jgi:AhpD family alkylhydroperoxidase
MDWAARAAETRDALRVLNRTIPEATRGFATLSKAVKEGGVLDVRQKEWVALGISVAMRCDDCIAFHVEALIKAGGTREELGDVLAMAVQMGGGPALMYAARALACWDQMAPAPA